MKMLKNPNEFEKGKTLVYFIRHGERIHIPNSPESGMIQPGPGLTKLGKKQAQKAAKELSKIKNEIDELYCSSMARAIETAEIISKKINKKPKIIPELSEFDNSAWKRKIHTKRFWKNYLKHKKAIKKFNKILEKHKRKVLVFVIHGNVIKALLFRKMGLSLKKSGMFHTKNCNFAIAQYKNKKLTHICCFNSNSIEHKSIGY